MNQNAGMVEYMTQAGHAMICSHCRTREF